VLSGFLITGILLETKGSTHYFRNFYARRILRIFPLYWGFLFVYFVILPNIVSLAPGSPFAAAPGIQPWFWLFASNLLSLVPGAAIPPGLNHFWSLAVEEQFYLIWPAIVFAASIKTLERTCIALVVVAFAFRLFLLTTPYHHTRGYVLLPARIDTLAIGAWLAAIARDASRREVVERWAPRAFLIALVALAIANLPDLRMFGYLPLIIVLEMAGLHMRTLSGGRPPGILAALGYSVLMSIATFLVAVASWHLYEKHFLKLKRLFPRGKSQG